MEKPTFRQLFDQYLSRPGIKTVEQKADRCGMNTEHLRQILNGNRIPSDEVLVPACEKLGLTDEQTHLLMILAAMERPKSMPDKWQEIIDLMDQLQARSDRMEVVPERIPVAEPKIPIYASVTAGAGEHGFTSSELIDEIRLPIDLRKGTFGLVVSGDSMNGPDAWISSGEYAIFEPLNGDNIPDNEIVLVWVEGWTSSAIKRIRREPTGHIALISDNPNYPPILVDPSVKRHQVQGVFAGSWKPARKKAKVYSVNSPAARYSAGKK